LCDGGDRKGRERTVGESKKGGKRAAGLSITEEKLAKITYLIGSSKQK